MAKLVWHPRHRTAFSARTTGFPLLGLDRAGNIVWSGMAHKYPGYLSVPDETYVFVWCYRTGGGNTSAIILKAEDGMPEITRATNAMPMEKVAEVFSSVGIGKVPARISKWLWGLEREIPVPLPQREDE